MNQTNEIFGLLAQTAVHAGIEKSSGVIDLAIQRESFNNWPCVYGSSVKGALRSKAMDEQVNKSNLNLVFGSGMGSARDQAGALAVGDARLLLFPIRSLTSQFKWVTCPAALNRYRVDSKRIGRNIEFPTDFKIEKNQALIHESQNNAALFLEENRFRTIKSDLNEVIGKLALLMNGDDAANRLGKQLVIVNDDSFSYFVQHCTAVNAHIAIDRDSKVVKPGALWYEETLPPETLFYFVLSASNSRSKKSGAEITAETILDEITTLFSQHPWLRLGGNETVGMGWCAVRSAGSLSPKR